MLRHGFRRPDFPASVSPLRAILALFVLASVTFATLASGSSSISIGLVDYSKKNFKLGDWVRYKIETTDSHGHEDLSYQLIKIVGEEVFRGERCFWLETESLAPGQKYPSYDLTLISEEAFKDPDADMSNGFYLRAMLLGFDDNGHPEITEVHSKAPVGKVDYAELRGKIDTVGVEAMETPKGKFDTVHLTQGQRLENTRPMSDSTVVRITVTRRALWKSRRVPITSLAREHEIKEYKLKAYKLGTVSTEVPEVLLETASYTATIVDWGTGAKSETLAAWQKNKSKRRPLKPDNAGLH